MAVRRRKYRCLAIRAAALAALLAPATPVAAARAGTLNLTLGTTPTGCAASPWFAAGMTGDAYCSNSLSIFKYGDGWDVEPGSPTVGAGAAGLWQINAPAGITIESVNIPTIVSSNLVSSSAYGWRAGDFWSTGSSIWSPSATSAQEGAGSPLNSSYYGFKLWCYASSCKNTGYLDVPRIDMTANENQGPGLDAVGANNLWYQGGSWVWNPTADPWSIELLASDASGICNMWAYAGTTRLDGPAATPTTDSFEQCPSPVDWTPGEGAAVDSAQYVPAGTSGTLKLEFDATNAANVTSSVAETLNVDSVQPTVALSMPNDANPGGWSVNHAVTVVASAHTGPSGLAGLTCSVDHGASQPYPTGGVSVNGNGTHTVTCTAANGAVDPQGAHNTGSATMTIDIDEQPPTLAFLPQDPANPAQVMVDTSDGESSVAGGQVQIAPKGTSSWTNVATTFTSGGQLVATIPDAGLSGPYTIQATACSQVGNCGSTSETLALPLRLAASSDVSFQTLADPLVAKKLRVRLRVGWHWVAVLQHGQAVKVKRGGHWRWITVTRMVEQCTHKRVKTGKHRWKLTTTCRAPHVALKSTDRAPYGQPVTVHGLLLTSQNVPIANAPVQIVSAPDNGLNQFTPVTSTTTDAGGGWSATVPAGPSRLIDAIYGGSSTTLPATGQVKLTVSARIQLSITPRMLPWSGSITIRGQLEGGYVPSDGVALRLLVRYPGSRSKSGLLAFRTNPAGAFAITWSYHAGISVLTIPFWVASDSNESDYPFASSQSAGISVTFGRATPRRHGPSKPAKKTVRSAGSGSVRRARQSPRIAPTRSARS